MKINVKAFALACGLIWGAGLFLLTWWIIAFEGVTHEVTLIGRLYRGYNISPAGSVMGFLWGLADGLLGGAVFAWLYNSLTKRAISVSSAAAEVEQAAPAARW
jgi:hypothetical protein